MNRIAIVEDSSAFAETLHAYCDRYAKEKNREFYVDVYYDGLDFVSEEMKDYDIIMLDIKMPHMDGLQTAKMIRESNENVCIVFITSMQQYAIQGYSVQATDFIVKPVQYSLFSFKMDRILAIAERNQQQTIAIKTNRTIKRLNVSEIIYVETQLHKLIYHTKTEDYETWGSMKEACELISPFSFALCSNSYLVNLRYVEEIKGACVVVNGVPLPISRTKHKSFLDAFMSFARHAPTISKAP